MSLSCPASPARIARALFAFACALLLALPLAACENQDDYVVLGESSGSTAEPIAAEPLEGIDASSRVVALSRSVGELWLLAGGELAGTTDDGLTLPNINEDATSIGTLTSPDLEKVKELKPDLVLLTEDLPSHQAARKDLQAADIPVLVVDINSFDDYAAAMAELTEATGRSDLYERNVTNVSKQVDEVIANSAKEDRGTYVALRISESKSTALGSDSFVCDMLDDLGLTNKADGESASPKEVAAADPDWIFVVYQGNEGKAQEAFEGVFASDPAWSELRAVREGHVVMLPKPLFQYKPNAKWGEAYAYLSQVLHGAWA